MNTLIYPAAGVGEASFLALSSFYKPSRKVLTAWSSGTGFAGIFGYAWVRAHVYICLYVCIYERSNYDIIDDSSGRCMSEYV